MSIYSQLDRIAADVRRLDDQVKAVSNAPQSQRTSVEGGSIDFNDSDGNLKAIVGAQDDGGYTTNVISGPTPPTPTNFTVEVDYGKLVIHWDGEFEDGAVAPTDWDHWSAYASQGQFVVPDRATDRGGNKSASGGEVTVGVEKGQWTVTVVAWSQAGKPSATATPVTVEVPGYGDLVQVALDQAQELIDEAKAELDAGQADLADKIGEAETALAGLRETLDNLDETTLPALRGDLDAAEGRLDTAEGQITDAFGQIVDAKTVAGRAETAANDAAQDATAAQSVADQAKSDAAAAAGIANGKGKVLVQSSAPGAADRNAQTLWIDTTGGANTPKRWVSGTTWQAVTDKAATDAAAAAVAAGSKADEAKTAADNAKSAADAAKSAADSAQSTASKALASANGKSVVHYEDAPPTESDPGVEGDTWFVGEFGRPNDVVQATNLVANPSFEVGTSGWNITWPNRIASITRTSNSWGVASGGYGLEVVGSSTPSSGGCLVASDEMPVSEGQWVNSAACMRAGSAYAVSAALRVSWKDSSGATISGSSVTGYNVLTANSNSSPTSRYVGSGAQAPAGAVGFTIYVQYRSEDGTAAPPAGFVAHLDDVQCMVDDTKVPVAGLSDYFDGDTPSGESDDDPHYRWTGEPHASPSEKYLPATNTSNWEIREQYKFTGGVWVQVELNHQVISSMDVGKLVAGSAAIAEAVVAKIAAQTASIQQADVKNLFVTGTASLSNVVAERIAAETAEFIELEVGNLVAGTGTMDEATITKLFTDVVVAGMSIATEFIGENAILTGAVTAPKITASEELWAKIGEFVQIRAEQIQADAIDGMVITGATYRTSGGSGSWSDAGLFIAQPDGTSMVRFPTDGSPLSLTASDVQIERASITDLDLANGSVRSGGTMSLAAGVTPPASPPDLSSGWAMNDTLPRPPERSMDWTGIAVWNGLYVRGVNVLGAAGDSADRIELYNPDGTFNKSINIDLNPRAGVAVIGDIVYTIGPDHVAANAGKQWCHGFNLNTGARVSRWEFTDFAGGTNKLGIGTHGANLLVAGNNLNVSQRVHLLTFNPATGEKIGDTITTNEWVAYTKDIQGVHRDGNNLYMSHRGATRKFTISGTTITYDPSGGWGNPNKNAGGMTFVDGVPIVADSGAVYKGSGFASDVTVQACFTWFNGTHETTPSPIASVALKPRESVTVSVGRRAGLQKRLYCRVGSGNWERTTLGEDETAATIYELSPFTPKYPLPTVNTFPASTPATLKSTNDKFVVKGDGSGHWGNFNVDANGAMSGLVVTGRILCQVDTARTPKKFTVQLPAGRFTKPPVVWFNTLTSAPQNVAVSVAGDDITTTSFDLWFYRTEKTGTSVDWFAMDAG